MAAWFFEPLAWEVRVPVRMWIELSSGDSAIQCRPAVSDSDPARPVSWDLYRISILCVGMCRHCVCLLFLVKGSR